MRSQGDTLSGIHRIRTSHVLCAAGLVALLLGTGTYAKTRQTRSTETRGLLGDYSQLSEDETDRVALIYVNPDVDWRDYDAVMIDSVIVWHASDDLKLSDDEAQMLTDHHYASPVVLERASPLSPS